MKVRKNGFCKGKFDNIENVLEIRIINKRWRQICAISKLKGTSYSWVVRYCVFRFIKHNRLQLYKNPSRNSKKYQDAINRAQNYTVPAKSNNTLKLHRHKLCLYGKDEFFIRMSAASLDWTMSQLIRFCIEWNLDNLTQSTLLKVGRFHSLAFYWLGIKLFSKASILNQVENNAFIMRKFKTYEYW